MHYLLGQVIPSSCNQDRKWLVIQMILIAKGSPKFLQPGPEVANIQDDLYVIYMMKTSLDP